jgi:hypothetical protein
MHYMLLCVPAVPVPEPWYGDYAGTLADPQHTDVKGDVYIVNNTCVQVMSFMFNSDTAPGGMSPV